MKIKEQTRKLAAGCSKHCFEVVDETDEVSNHTYGKVKLGTDEVSSKHVLRLWIELTKSAQNMVLRLQIELTKSAQNTF
ncbi:hypothetical protein [Streptococcus pneumoniae]|uniref:hypothetical protein n=1 Tax=Streptococcus pneumoniae TaxID=1313 RepID=UPI00067C7A69|nr:hypothetical protein [Streptococcus pneumoniae]